MRRLVLVRHGESRWNAEARIQGQRCAGLSSLGHEQAARTAAALTGIHGALDVRLVSSDLRRTLETVAPLEQAFEQPADRDPRLRERSFGTWEGRLRAEVVSAEGPRWQRWLAGEDVVEEVGGESAGALTDRVAPVLRALLDTTPAGGVTIVVTHGGPIWHGTHRLLGLPSGTFAGVDNACLTEIVDLDGRVAIDRWNDVGHLPPHLRTGWRPAAPAAARVRPTSAAPPVGR